MRTTVLAAILLAHGLAAHAAETRIPERALAQGSAAEVRALLPDPLADEERA